MDREKVDASEGRGWTKRRWRRKGAQDIQLSDGGVGAGML